MKLKLSGIHPACLIIQSAQLRLWPQSLDHATNGEGALLLFQGYVENGAPLARGVGCGGGVGEGGGLN